MQCQYRVSLKNTFFSFKQERPVFRRSISAVLPSQAEEYIARERFVEIVVDHSYDSCSEATTVSRLSPRDSCFEEKEAEREARNAKYAPWRQLNQFVSDNSSDETEWTTIMINNIPNKYTQDMLAEEILSTGNECNFVHMPISKKKPKSNLGYAFVNFVTSEAAQDFLEVFEGRVWSKHPNCRKRAGVGFAKLQGFEANVAFFSSRRIAASEHKPWISPNMAC
jgi:RNA recognition motif-containing protein